MMTCTVKRNRPRVGNSALSIASLLVTHFSLARAQQRQRTQHTQQGEADTQNQAAFVECIGAVAAVERGQVGLPSIRMLGRQHKVGPGPSVVVSRSSPVSFLDFEIVRHMNNDNTR